MNIPLIYSLGLPVWASMSFTRANIFLRCLSVILYGSYTCTSTAIEYPSSSNCVSSLPKLMPVITAEYVPSSSSLYFMIRCMVSLLAVKKECRSTPCYDLWYYIRTVTTHHRLQPSLYCSQQDSRLALVSVFVVLG